MKITAEELPKSQVKLCITLPPERFDRCYQFALREASKKTTIEGFRKGRAPEHLVEQQMGKDALLRDASEIAVQQSLQDALAQEKIEAVGRPEITVQKAAPGNEFLYDAIVSRFPSFTLPDYSTLSGAQKPKTIEENDIDKQLKMIQNTRAKLTAVTRPAQKRDMVEIDFEVRVNGAKIEGGESKRHPFILGEGKFIPGFEDHIVGMQAQETKTFDLAFPKDYHVKHYAGNVGRFTVTVHSIQERELPELNDAFAQSLGPYKVLKEIRDAIQKQLEQEERHRAKNRFRDSLAEQLIKDLTIEVPDILIESEVDRMIHDLEHQLQETGMTLEKYFEHLNKTREQVVQELEPAAKKRVISFLALREVAHKEQFSVSDDEVNVEYAKLLAAYPNQEEIQKQINEEGTKKALKDQLLIEKVFNTLEKIADSNTAKQDSSQASTK